jgi:hypothetical protein
MSFQGFLTNQGNAPVNGPRTIIVKFFSAALGGAQIWSRTYDSHPVSAGKFDMTLDGGSPDFSTLAFNDSWWIQLVVDGEVISPRTMLAASPFANGLSLPVEAEGDVGGVGSSAFKVTNTATSGPNNAIFGVSNSTSGKAVNGFATASSGSAYGVYGESASSEGRGLSGLSTALSGEAVGVYGESKAPQGTGVYGLARSSSGNPTGVYGESSGVFGSGVEGRGENGVLGRTNRVDGRGVFGVTSFASGWAGYFWGGQGVYAQGDDNNSPDLVLGGNDDGRIFSDPLYNSSDIWLHSNDAVVIQLDNDGSGQDADFTIKNKDGTNIFNVDEDGTVTVDGMVEHSSDRNRKHGIVPIDAAEILDEVALLPISRWMFKGQSVEHVGPMAQDFYSSFGVGADDKHIVTADANGVALAAIQGLYELVKQQQVMLAQQQAEIEQLRRIVEGEDD